MAMLPKGVELLKQSWQIFKQKVKILLLIQLVPLIAVIPIIILAGAVGMLNEQGGAITPNVWGAKEGTVLLALIVVGVVGILLQLWTQIAMIMAIDSLEPELRFKSLFRRARPLIWPYLGVSILMGLIVFGGLILLIVPGIIFAIWYSMSVYALVLEGQRGMAALRTSKSYVKGHTGQVLKRLAVLGLLAVLLFMIPGAILEAIHLKPLADVYGAVVGFVFGPISAIYLYLLFRALRDMKLAPQTAIPGATPGPDPVP